MTNLILEKIIFRVFTGNFVLNLFVNVAVALILLLQSYFYCMLYINRYRVMLLFFSSNKWLTSVVCCLLFNILGQFVSYISLCYQKRKHRRIINYAYKWFFRDDVNSAAITGFGLQILHKIYDRLTANKYEFWVFYFQMERLQVIFLPNGNLCLEIRH